MVIPAPIRRHAGLKPGTELEVIVDDTSVRLVRRVPGPHLVNVGGRLVARPTEAQDRLPVVAPAALVEAERSRWPW